MPGVDKPGTTHCANCERLARELEAVKDIWVLVRKDDLELALDWFSGGTEETWQAMDRLEPIRAAEEKFNTPDSDPKATIVRCAKCAAPCLIAVIPSLGTLISAICHRCMIKLFDEAKAAVEQNR